MNHAVGSVRSEPDSKDFVGNESVDSGRRRVEPRRIGSHLPASQDHLSLCTVALRHVGFILSSSPAWPPVAGQSSAITGTQPSKAPFGSHEVCAEPVWAPHTSLAS
jgi:hypothetical protein